MILWRQSLVALSLGLAGLHFAHAGPTVERNNLEQAISALSNLQRSQVVPEGTSSSSTKPDFDGQSFQKGIVTQAENIGKGFGGVVDKALTFLGTPYRYGGTSAATGFDCSGFVQAVFARINNISLPRTAAAQAQATAVIDKSELRPGDLVFFNTMRRSFSHVGIYVGDGRFVHAPRTGRTVGFDNMNSSYWSKRFNGARRVMVR